MAVAFINSPSPWQKLGLTLILLLITEIAAAAGPTKKTWQTYPMPPKVKPADPMRFAPGVSVPENPERFTWKITAPKDESKITEVPVYVGEWDRGLTKIGNVAIGTVVTLGEVRRAGRSHYYSLKFTPENGKETTAWVSGRYIAVTGQASLAPVQ